METHVLQPLRVCLLVRLQCKNHLWRPIFKFSFFSALYWLGWAACVGFVPHLSVEMISCSDKKKKKTKNDVRSPSKVEATTRVFYTWEFDVESVSYENISCIIYPVSELSPVSISCNIFYFSLRSWIIFLYCCWKWRLIRLHYPSTWLTDLNITQDLIH